jgi:hypothetical protein
MTVPTFLIQVIPGAPDSVEVMGYAKARVQRATFAAGDGPFIVCGSHSWAVIDASGVAVDADVPIWAGGKINPAAVGVTYRVHDPKISQTGGGANAQAAGCNTQGARFNGLNDQNAGNSGVGSWYRYDTGTSAGPTRAKVNGTQGCAANTAGPYNCVMILPIAVNSPAESGNSKSVYVVALAAFYVTTVDANTHNAKLLDDYVLAGSGNNGWCRDCGGLVVVRLVW